MPWVSTVPSLARPWGRVGAVAQDDLHLDRIAAAAGRASSWMFRLRAARRPAVIAVTIGGAVGGAGQRDAGGRVGVAGDLLASRSSHSILLRPEGESSPCRSAAGFHRLPLQQASLPALCREDEAAGGWSGRSESVPTLSGAVPVFLIVTVCGLTLRFLPLPREPYDSDAGVAWTPGTVAVPVRFPSSCGLLQRAAPDMHRRRRAGPCADRVGRSRSQCWRRPPRGVAPQVLRGGWRQRASLVPASVIPQRTADPWRCRRCSGWSAPGGGAGIASAGVEKAPNPEVGLSRELRRVRDLGQKRTSLLDVGGAALRGIVRSAASAPGSVGANSDVLDRARSRCWPLKHHLPLTRAGHLVGRVAGDVSRPACTGAVPVCS